MTLDISDRDEWYALDPLERADALRQTVTLPEVAELMGLEPDSRDKVHSPFNPEDHTPSCHLYDDHFYDYSTGRWGDVFDFVQAFHPDAKFSDIIKMIHSRAVRSGKEYGDVEVEKPRIREDFTAVLAPKATSDSCLGLPVRGFGVRHDPDGTVYVPHRDEDGVYGVKVRYPGGGKGALPGSQFMTRLYDPWGWMPPYLSDRWLICEGESDAWAFESLDLGLAVFALPSGAGSWRDHWLQDLESYVHTVWICMDNDQAGQRAKDKLMLKVGYERARELKVPTLYNDAREAIKAGWKPRLED